MQLQLNKCITIRYIGTGKEVEATCSKYLVLSLLPREEPIDGDTIVPSTLHSHRSTATPYILFQYEMLFLCWQTVLF